VPTLDVQETQAISPSGIVTDQYVITYQVPGHDTVVTFTIPRTGNVVADAQAARDAIVNEIDALFGL